MLYKPRDYQFNDFHRLRTEYKAGARSILHVSPTGSGKTVVFCMIVESAYKKGKSILILTHRDNLLRQIMNKLNEVGLKHGVIAAGYPSIRYRIQVASVQTLNRRLDRWDKDSFDLIIIDEAHHIIAKTWSKIIDHFSKAKLYGCTATPIRLDGQGLGNYFDSMVVGPSFNYLVNMGYLSKPRYFIPEHIDLSDIKIIGGDYNKKQLVNKFDKRFITGNAIEFYAKYCDKEPAMAFCVSIDHAEHVAEQFRQAEYISQAIHSKMDYKKIHEIINDLGQGKIHVVTSCEIVGEGTDIPILKTVILLRPTQSLALNHQQNGRASRPYPGKENSIHLDMAGNCEHHGFIDIPIKWELTTGKYKPQIAPVKTCQYCFASFLAYLKKCPECGQQNISRKKRGEPMQVKGNLKEIDYKTLNHEIEKAENIIDFQKIQDRLGYQPGWAWYMWNQKKEKILERP